MRQGLESLLFLLWLGCFGCCPGCGAEPSVAAPGEPPCHEEAGLPEQSNAIDLSIGVPDSEGLWTAVSPDETIEIVQGPQQGVHVEIALKVTLPEHSSPTVKVLVQAASFQPCKCSNPVGAYHNGKYLLFAAPEPPGTYISGMIPVIFEEREAHHYAGEECCVTVWVTVDEVTGSATHAFSCVDESSPGQ